MQKTEDIQMAKSAHRQVRTSTTLNRRYVKKPTRNADIMVGIKKSPQIKRYATYSTQTTARKDTDNIAPAKSHPLQTTARARMQARERQANPATQQRKMSAKELKDQAIKKALASASNSQLLANQITKTNDNQKKTGRIHFGIGRVILALSCAVTAVFAIVYFVNLNMPDISLRVAAMQTGINASYPTYVPRDYKLSGITSEQNKIILNFKNTKSDENFDLIEEKSSWDSNALLNNFVKEAYGENYSVIREQGLTIYINGSNAAWVNGGIVYKIESNNSNLTNKQINSIATSL